VQGAFLAGPQSMGVSCLQPPLPAARPCVTPRPYPPPNPLCTAGFVLGKPFWALPAVSAPPPIARAKATAPDASDPADVALHAELGNKVGSEGLWGPQHACIPHAPPAAPRPQSTQLTPAAKNLNPPFFHPHPTRPSPSWAWTASSATTCCSARWRRGAAGMSCFAPDCLAAILELRPARPPLPAPHLLSPHRPAARRPTLINPLRGCTSSTRRRSPGPSPRTTCWGSTTPPRRARCARSSRPQRPRSLRRPPAARPAARPRAPRLRGSRRGAARGARRRGAAARTRRRHPGIPRPRRPLPRAARARMRRTRRSGRTPCGCRLCWKPWTCCPTSPACSRARGRACATRTRAAARAARRGARACRGASSCASRARPTAGCTCSSGSPSSAGL
jgi:hypothetical protein